MHTLSVRLCIDLRRLFAAVLSGVLAAIACVLVAVPAQAAENSTTPAPTAKQCGEQWKKAKAAGAIRDGQTWPQFLSACRSGKVTVSQTAAPSSDNNATVPAVDKGMTATAVDEKVPTPVAPAAATTSEMSSIMSVAKACGKAWKEAKAAGTVPSDQTWPQYLKKCSADRAPFATATPATTKSPGNAAAEPLKTVAPTVGETAHAKPLSVAKQCGAQWRAAKAAGTLPPDQKWPAYLKTCRAALAANPLAANTPTTDASAKTALTKAAVTGAAVKDIDPASTAGTPQTPALNATPALKATAAAGTAAGLATAEAATAARPKASGSETAAASTTAKSGKPASTKSTKQVASIAALNARKKTCSAAWQQAKTAGTIPAGQTWPKFWSECNSRLKAEGG